MAITTTSCSLLSKVTDKKPQQPQPEQTVGAVTETESTVADDEATSLKPLEGEWSITEVLGQEVVVNGENHPKLTLTPKGEGMLEVIGYNGCNYLNGVWNIRGNRIIPAGEMISSLRACPDAPYEFSVNQALGQTAGYTVADDSNITLSSASGNDVMKLRKRGLAFLNGAWKVTSIDGEPITANIYIVLDIDEHKVHGNAGCNLLNGEIVVNLDKGDGIEFRNLVTTRMSCPDLATERQFLVAMENVATVAKGTNDDNASLLDSSAKPVVTLQRLSAEQLKELSDE